MRVPCLIAHTRVDLGLLRFVSAIGTQGAISKETKKKYFLKTYRVDVSSNGEDWISVKDGNNKPLVFVGNTNPTDIAYRTFPKPVLTRFVRIKPASWETGISLRFEVYGCKITDYPCSGMLGMVSGLITDSQITASNEFERNWIPENVRLITSRVGWALPPPATHTYAKEWLQIDLGEEKIVRGIIVQGVPTSIPTTADSNLVDECDDDQANCHSGTGDDFQLTGSTTAMITERPTAIDTTVQPELPAYGFNCGFGYSSQKTICRWEHDSQLDLRWAVLTSKTGPIQDHTAGDGNFIYSQADENQKGKVARLISPIINPQNSALCMTFWYHMSGAHVGTLRIKLRYHTLKEYDQVMVEGEIGKGTGGIAVDDINFDSHIAQEECRKSNDAGNEIVEVEPDINQTGFTPDYRENGEPYNDNISRKPGNVLKTLDPILITIIAMSALGVLLGAICGVILYCACWHNGMSDRNLSALENYNFELVDGVKLKKDKLNAQNTYSEA
ncbi:hypothetical protein JD844_003412 [Phrynosoma platyrhinos]|uniref:Neuropilin n=1 Tax=Phrynosoma platyrhinos TaxID=52577 RepID=A0ABQ7TD28_PHRPL|nr:hypothetical protein JD844_003412 [Phrynosoma platyrhinos]